MFLSIKVMLIFFNTNLNMIFLKFSLIPSLRACSRMSDVFILKTMGAYDLYTIRVVGITITE